MLDKYFYTTTENKAFWVVGYDTWNVKDIEKDAKTFAKKLGVSYESIATTVIENSSRYKRMRVFFADVKECPKGFSEINTNSLDFLRV